MTSADRRRFVLWPRKSAPRRVSEVKVLLWHGYLLSGTGSNLYTANIAKRWRAMGHDVLLLCQDRDAAGFDFVDGAGDFEGSNRSYATSPTGAVRGPGRCRVVRPSIRGMLPVFVYDFYEGFTTKLFVDLSEVELDAYTNVNITALVTAIEDFDPDAIITGHEVMGPYIAKQACAATGKSYVAKLHGSGLEYAVRLQDRYLRYATEGLSAAIAVVGGSRYMVEAAGRVVPGWIDKSAVVSPGCDIELFKPSDRSQGQAAKIGYVGKLIVAKGVHHFLAALCRTAPQDLEGVVVGFGGYAEELRRLWDALHGGDRRMVTEIVRRGDGHPLEHLLRFLERRGDDDGFYERAGGIDVEWPGRLEHDALAPVLAGWDVLVVPSIVPEAFGMVAAEAAACAVLPVVPRHSGIGEVGVTLEEHLGRPGLLSFDPADPIEDLARAIDGILSLQPGERAELSAGVAEVARTAWSWERTAERLLQLATEGVPHASR